MSILAPLWAKAILGLGLALGASLVGNFLLVRHMWIEAGEAKGEVERQALAARVEGFEKTEAINLALNAQSKEDHEALLTDLEKIAAGAAANQGRSQKVTKSNPLPANCKPGQERMGSVNKTLGPQQ